MREFGDLRFGARMLFKRPGTTSLAILALALGIGLTTTMFTVVDGVFLRGLPFERSDQIVGLARPRLNGRGADGVPAHDLVDWRASQHSFEDLAGATSFPVNVSSTGDLPERFRAASITPNTLRLLRVRPALGRDFSEADSRAGAPLVVLISHNVWTGRFRQAADAVGKAIRVNGEPAAIVGVMPEQFGYPHAEDVWMPLKLTLPARRGDGPAFDVMGRLKNGVGVRSALSDMKTIAGQLARQYPENRDFTASVVPYIESSISPRVIATLSTMLGAVFGVLLIACVNVTNLQLARAAERMKEMAIRFALGATRWRVVRQLLFEGLILSAAGAVLGLGMARVGIALVKQNILDSSPPFWIDFRIDGRVLAFVVGLTVLCAIVSSLAPALRVARQSVNDVLKDEGRSSTGLRVGLFSRLLVVVEMTLSFVLLVVSGLMLKSVIATSTISYPFATDLLVARTTIDDKDYPTDEQVRQLVERLDLSFAGTAGVRQVAIATGTPNGGGRYDLSVEGQPAPATGASRPSVRRIGISPRFFDVLRVQLRAGRAATDADRATSLPVAVVSDDLVRKFFPKGDALASRIRLGTDEHRPWLTIVGIVPSLAVAPQPGEVTETVFVPLAQTSNRDFLIFIAGNAPQAVVGPALRRTAAAVDPNLPIFNINSLQEQYDQSSWPFRVFGGLFMTFGLAALFMAAAGLYGVMSFAVRRRTQEIGVRMALGADRSRITSMVVRQGLWQVGVGVVLGFGLAGLLGRSLTLLLFQVRPWDPTVFGCTIGVLSGVGALASLIPALRAASVDPLVALRRD